MSIVNMSDGLGLYIKKASYKPEDFFAYAIKIKALEFYPKGINLKSGRLSPYFFNAGLFCSGEKLVTLARFYARAVVDQGIDFDLIYGPAYKGIPLATSLAMMLNIDHGRDVDYAFNRKEEKDHGEGGSVVGASLAGKGVLLVDDVMTTGTSLNEAIETIKGAGGIPVGCVVALDREETASNHDKMSAVQNFEGRHKIPVIPVVTLTDLVDAMNRTPDLVESNESGKVTDALERYKLLYGV